MYAGLIYDDSRHYIDHLAPFCALLNWPLIVCEPTVAALARAYYPDLEVKEIPLWDLQLPSHIVTCDPLPMFQAAFPTQTCKTLWLPHGNSDKGWKGPFFEGLGEIAFVYGQKMIDFMRAKNGSPQTLRVGNFRWHYFLKHQAFYQKMTLPLKKSSKNILYAPTWEDSENNGSFWKAFPILADHFPKECHLLVKLHPNTLWTFAAEVEMLIGRYAKGKNIFFLPEIPPIYPILAQCDAYIGDMSSIGYDFLTFDRPMYFFNANQELPLHRCGAAIEPKHFAFSHQDPFSEIRKATYDYTFDPAPNWNQLKEQIHALCGV